MSGILKPGESPLENRLAVLEQAVNGQGQLLKFLEHLVLTAKKVLDQVQVNEPPAPPVEEKKEK